MQIRSIPVGTFVHALELNPGHGAQLVRSAGAYGQIVGKTSQTDQNRRDLSDMALSDEDAEMIERLRAASAKQRAADSSDGNATASLDATPSPAPGQSSDTRSGCVHLRDFPTGPKRFLGSTQPPPPSPRAL